mgnify:FL=1
MIEFKDYTYPFDGRKDTLIKNICAFINHKGGRIYIGITDTGKVVGVNLDRQQMDQLPRDILSYVANFYPNIKSGNLVTTKLIPVEKNGREIPGLVIVKIIVRQGDPNILYFASDKECVSYVRKEANCFEIKKPADLLQQLSIRARKPLSVIPDYEFDDPEPKIPSPKQPSGVQKINLQPQEPRRSLSTSQRDRPLPRDKSAKKSKSPTQHYQVVLVTPIEYKVYEQVVDDNMFNLKSLIAVERVSQSLNTLILL